MANSIFLFSSYCPSSNFTFSEPRVGDSFLIEGAFNVAYFPFDRSKSSQLTSGLGFFFSSDFIEEFDLENVPLAGAFYTGCECQYGHPL